jgi:hypothetical protein
MCGCNKVKTASNSTVKVGAKLAPTFIDMTSKGNSNIKVNVSKQSDTTSS